MGYTFSPGRGEGDALEGEFCDGRTNAICDSTQRCESMALLCREFCISRKTGYKIFERYEEGGLEGSVTERAGQSGTPTSCPSKLKRQSW